MKFLLACFSKTGHTRQLALAIRDELKSRGHSVMFEEIQRKEEASWVREVLRDFKSYPLAFTRVLFGSRAFKEDFFRRYSQVEEDIKPLQYPDVSEFDRICIGGPKWVYISYPVARYLKTVNGLEGKPVGTFSTFCGPPIQAFEIDMLDIPMTYALEARGGAVAATLGITTAYHECGVGPLFRLASWILFRQPIANFTLGSTHARRLIRQFCDRLERPAN